MKKRSVVPVWVQASAIGGAAAALVVGELFRTLRVARRENKLKRSLRNGAIAGLAAVVVQFAENPLALRLGACVERRGFGIVPLLGDSTALRLSASVALLDYGLYIWHVLTHKVPFLWRFHLVHHIDLDLDASTALRFHFGEMLLSVPWRLMQIAIAGASPRAISIWRTLLTVSILFHHSNVRLPRRLERVLGYLIMTPRLHGIHHEADLRGANSNWSSGLAVWDLLHHTRNTQPATETIGVPAWQNPGDVRLHRCLTIPFEPQRDDFTAYS